MGRRSERLSRQGMLASDQAGEGDVIQVVSRAFDVLRRAIDGGFELAMCRCEKPIIAKVHGHAMGGGLGLVAASTFAIATEDAQLGTPEINVGLFHCYLEVPAPGSISIRSKPPR